MVSAVFLDRDGVIIEDRAGFVRSWNDVAFIPGAFKSIARLTRAGLPIVIVTNQSAVGRGYITTQFVDETHSRMAAEIASHGGHIDGIYYCPHHPDAGCECRKPAPGLLISAARDIGVELASTVMVGDSIRDIQAANSAGSRGILVLTGKGKCEAAALAAAENPFGRPAAIVADISAATDYILSTELD